jgi:hypothetical protein
MFALDELTELLIGIAFPVVEVGFIEFVAVILAKTQKIFEIIKDRCDSGIGFERGLAHVAVLLDIDGKIGAVSFVSYQATILAILGDLYPYRPARISICYLYI